MAKLYPPQIGGTVPAFYKNSENKLTIPFIMNKTVSKNEVYGFNLIVKTVANSKLIGNLRVAISNIDDLPPWNFTKGEIYFTINENDVLWNSLYPGQYYKIQLAYIDKNGIIGYYSSVGVIKFTTMPTISIEGLDFEAVNMNENVFVGTYSQSRLEDGTNRDVSEKVYSYCFNIYDENGNLYDTSGEQLHNSFEDENAYSSRDMFTIGKELIANKNYFIQYEITTINHAFFRSSKYRIMSKETIDPEINAELQIDLNSDNGYINVRLRGIKDEYGVEHAATGSFVLKRGSSKDNYATWDSILMFRLNGNLPSRWLWRDMTVEHGHHYKYALQQFNDYGLYSNKIYSNEVYVAFEDSFLYDGVRQLKLQFNPKMGSFKDTILETKTNTIGSKYPFIFRNGKVGYKEFPISGLISYMSDDEELFITKDELFLQESTLNLTDNNIAAERIFKMKVLEFFNDGKPKMFRSPTEGNFIVRLMNASMAPTDQLGRMLHTISATASEVSDFSYDSLLEHGFLQLIDIKNPVTRWETIPIVYRDDFGNVKYHTRGEELLNYSPATTLYFENMIPGARFELTDEFNEKIIITIGITGTYKVDTDVNFLSVKMDSEYLDQGSLTYSYESNSSNVFDTVEDVVIHDHPLTQFVGEHDIMKEVEDGIKFFLVSFSYLNFNKRAVYNLYEKDGFYYWDQDHTGLVPAEELEEGYIYKVLNNGEYYYIDGQSPNTPLGKYSNSFYLNGVEIDLTETEVYKLIKPEKITSLTMGSGLALECAYQTKELIYSLEAFNLAVQTARVAYEEALNEYKALSQWNESDGYYYDDEHGYTEVYFNDLNKIKEKLYGENGLYDLYLQALKDAIEQQKEEGIRYE